MANTGKMLTQYTDMSDSSISIKSKDLIIDCDSLGGV